MSANDQTYCASIQELPTLTPEELSARIQSLVWLTTPGNGASVEAVAKFKKELDRLRMLQDQKERIVA